MTNALIKQERVRLAGKYKTSRYNLLLVIIFTVINLVLLVTQSNRYFLFSATVPYFIADIGMTFGGMYPDEFYFETGISPLFDSTGFFFFLSIAIVILIFYFICFILSKEHKVGWIIAALVMFSIDTAALLLLYGLEGIIDIAFHGWVIFDLASGIKAYNDLKKLPELNPEEEAAAEETNVAESEVLYIADETVKHRVLLQTEVLGHDIVYRRIKGSINELVVDGKVYDRIEMVSERAHSLCAKIDGHEIKVGYNGAFASYAELDGEVIAKKTRLI